MKWKILLLIFLILALASILYFKPISLPSYSLSSITGFFSRAFYPQKPSSILITLESIPSEQNFQLLNTSLTINGICATPINLGKTSIQLTSYPCNIKMSSPFGTLKVKGNEVTIEANSDSIEINGINYYTPEKVYFKILASELFASVSSQELKIEFLKGKIEKLSLAGETSQVINFPPCKGIELIDFVGSIKISKGLRYLSGNAKGYYWCDNDKIQI
ncbi:MAG: hypothetical protein ACP5H3_01330 [Candidatus Aenigmatarchaeota archaeon]